MNNIGFRVGDIVRVFYVVDGGINRFLEKVGVVDYVGHNDSFPYHVSFFNLDSFFFCSDELEIYDDFYDQ